MTLWNEQLHYVFDPVGNLQYRTNNTLTENSQVNSDNQLTANTNGGSLMVMGTTTSKATNVTVNSTNTPQLYGDWTFAATNFPFLSSYTGVAADSLGRRSPTPSTSASAPTPPLATTPTPTATPMWRMLVSTSQAIAAKYLYDAFGNVLSAAGSLAAQNLYRCSSKEAHPNAGLAYYLYRYYDPNLQRWPNRDPLLESGFEFIQNRIPFPMSRFIPPVERPEGPNLYEFIHHRPIDLYDFLGPDRGIQAIVIRQTPAACNPSRFIFLGDYVKTRVGELEERVHFLVPQAGPAL